LPAVPMLLVTKFLEYFDFDNDGDVDISDQTQFNRRLNRY
jgi:hypothetical protein